MSGTNNTKYVASGIYNILVRLHTRIDSNGVMHIIGYPVFAQTLVQLDNSIQRQITATPQTASAKERYLIGRIVADYEARQKPHTPPASIKDGLFSDAYKKIEEPSTLCSHAWAASTKHRARTYLERQVLPRLDQYGATICADDLNTIKEDLITKAEMNKRGTRDRQCATGSVGSLLQQVNVMLQNLYASSFPSLPFVQFQVSFRAVKTAELPKAIDDDVRVRLSYMLSQLVDNGLTMGVAMMLYGGLRTSEACAPLWSELNIFETYATYAVLHQLDKDSNRIDLLKSDCAYRVIVLPYVMVKLLQARLEHLKSAGYDDADIRRMPLVSESADAAAFTRSNKLSSYAADLLRKCGYDVRHASVDALMRACPDLDGNGKALQSPSAYMLRRDWCTRACNICGMRMDTIDYLLGHANKKRKHTDYLTTTAQSIIAEQLERYVFDPGATLHPQFAPKALANSSDFDLPAETAFALLADCKKDETVQIRIRASCAELLDNIHIVSAADPALHEKKARADKPEDRGVRPLIGSPCALADYVALKKEVDCILSKNVAQPPVGKA